MTETLSDYEVDIMAKELRSDKEYPKGVLHSRLKQALNTIEAKDAEIEALKGQVAFNESQVRSLCQKITQTEEQALKNVSEIALEILLTKEQAL